MICQIKITYEGGITETKEVVYKHLFGSWFLVKSKGSWWSGVYKLTSAEEFMDSSYLFL